MSDRVVTCHCVRPCCHARVTVTTTACDHELLPEPEDRNGRHWMRVELSKIRMKFALKPSFQLWPMRDNGVADER